MTSRSTGSLRTHPDCQLYKQAGNGVTVNVIEAIGRNLRAVDTLLKQETSV